MNLKSLLIPVAVAVCSAVAYGETAGEDAEVEPWRQRFSVNISGSSGNTRSFDSWAGWRARRNTTRYRRMADARYTLGMSDSDVVQSAFTSGARQDWLIPDSTWFAFGEGRYDFDDFRAWRHRVSSHWGAGNELKKTETFELLARAGVGASKQWERTERLRPEGLLGAELAWDMADNQEFTASSYIYPRLDRPSEHRIVTRAELNIAIDRARGMSFVSGVEHEYESRAGTEARNWDFRYYAGISIGF